MHTHIDARCCLRISISYKNNNHLPFDVLCACVCVSGRLSMLLDSMLFANTKSCCFWCHCCCCRRFCCCCCRRLSMDLRTYQNINMYIFLNTQKRGAPMVNCCYTLSCYLSGSTDHFACCTPLCNIFFLNSIHTNVNTRHVGLLLNSQEIKLIYFVQSFI